MLRVLRDREVGVVFVSHILEDVMALCDEVTVLRDGQVAMSAPAARGADGARDRRRRCSASRRGGQTEAAAARRAAARRRSPRRSRSSGGGGLELRGVAVDGRLEELDLTVARGEVVGLAGVAGAGHHAVLELVSGLRRPDRGTVVLPSGAPVPHGLRRAIRRGRRAGHRRPPAARADARQADLGEHRPDPLGRARRGRADRALGRAAAARRATQVARLRIRSALGRSAAGSLSGGNQQKVVFAKWLDAAPSVVLLDDPTRGVDVGAKAEMHALIRSTAEAGAPVLICSTDIDELAVAVRPRRRPAPGPRVGRCWPASALRTHAVLEAMNTETLYVGLPATSHPKRRPPITARLCPRPLEIPGVFLRVCVLAWRRRRPVFRVQRHEKTHQPA